MIAREVEAALRTNKNGKQTSDETTMTDLIDQFPS
jgi:hypothetical protein